MSIPIWVDESVCGLMKLQGELVLSYDINRFEMVPDNRGGMGGMPLLVSVSYLLVWFCLETLTEVDVLIVGCAFVLGMVYVPLTHASIAYLTGVKVPSLRFHQGYNYGPEITQLVVCAVPLFDLISQPTHATLCL